MFNCLKKACVVRLRLFSRSSCSKSRQLLNAYLIPVVDARIRRSNAEFYEEESNAPPLYGVIYLDLLRYDERMFDSVEGSLQSLVCEEFECAFELR